MGAGGVQILRYAAIMLLLSAVAVFAAFAAPGRGEAQDSPRVDPGLTEELASAGRDERVVAIVTYDGRPTRDELSAVRRTGVAVHEFQELPMVAVRGTRAQVEGVLSLRAPVSVWGNKRLEYLLRQSRPLIGADRVQRRFGYAGDGIGVAVIDSGVDGTHPDVTFGQEMVQNVKILGDGFFTGATVTLQNQRNTDTSSGHGTHVAGTIGGSGKASDGYYTGVAPRADLVGIGAGDALFILYALEGFDYALENRKKYNIKVISNSWGTSGSFDKGDPVNVASKVAHDRGITVVFAAGNEGPGNNTMNPYAVAPWVIGVAAGDKKRKLADFSSRGRPGSALYAPDITGPGVDIVSARSSTGATINALTAADDATYIPPRYVARYTTASGTSMATPHVSGTAALMLDANPNLTSDGIRKALVATADPMPSYARHEVGAGYLDAFAAVSRVR